MLKSLIEIAIDARSLKTIVDRVKRKSPFYKGKISFKILTGFSIRVLVGMLKIAYCDASWVLIMLCRRAFQNTRMSFTVYFKMNRTSYFL